MDLISIFVTALGLSADSFAVSVSNGLSNRVLRFSDVAFIALIFALFQALMPLAGWLIAGNFVDEIKAADHWIAFFLLSAIGIKMIYESFSEKESSSGINKLSFAVIAAQSFATSIDALIIGITFAFIKVNITTAVIVIGIVTFIFSVSGFYTGKKFGGKFSGYADIAGGIILILLGIKILIEHIYFS